MRGFTMMKRLAALVAACALGLAGCAGAPGSDGLAAKPAHVSLSPSDEAYNQALKNLTKSEQRRLKAGLGFTLDTLLSKPVPIDLMAWSHRRQDGPRSVDIGGYVRFLDGQKLVGGNVRVNLATARVSTGVTHESKTFAPAFKIQIEVEPSNSAVMSVTASASGLPCNKAMEDLLDTKEFSGSEQVAFMTALLRTLLKVNARLEGVAG
jgi:hypothetical protein